MPLYEDYSFRPAADPVTLLRNAYGAMVNGLKSAATPGGAIIGQAGQPEAARPARRAQALGQYRFEQKHGAGGDPMTPHRPQHFTDSLMTNPQEVTAALTQMAGGGAMLAARGLTKQGAKSLARSGTTRTFLGPEAVDADLAKLQAAKEFADAGVSERDIWRTTGWGRGPDGNWIFEIPDEGLKLKPQVQQYLDELQEFANRPKPKYRTPEWDEWAAKRSELIQTRPEPLTWVENRDIQGKGLTGRLGDMVDHPAYFRNVPGAEDAPLSIGFPEPESLVRAEGRKSRIAYGAFNPQTETTSLKRKIVNSDKSLNYDQPLVHEMQHLADQKAGRQAGGNVASFLDDFTKEDAVERLHYAITSGHVPGLSASDIADPNKVWASLKDLEYWQLHAEPEDVMRGLFGKPRTAYQKYRGVPGELKGFSTQNRLGMDEARRRSLPPWEQPSWQKYDTPEEFNVPVESFLRKP